MNHSGGLGSSVGIATDYGLDGLGSNPGGDEIFRLPRLALGPTQPPVQWVPGLFWGYRWPGRRTDPPPPSSAKVPRKRRTIPLLPLPEGPLWPIKRVNPTYEPLWKCVTRGKDHNQLNLE